MPQLSLDIPHELLPAEAARRLKEKVDAARAEHSDRISDFQEEWRDGTLSFAFTALGMAVSGTVGVEPQQVRLAVRLPLAAMLFKSAIEQHIRREMGDLLAPAQADGDAS